MTKIKVKSLVSLSSLTFDAIQELIPNLKLKELGQMEDYITVTIEEDLNQENVNQVINGLRQYILANLITGEII